MGLPRLLEATPSILEEGGCLLDPCPDRGHQAGLLDQLGLRDRVVDERCCALVVALRREVRAERRCPLPGPDLGIVGSLPNVGRIVRVRDRLVGVEQVGGDDLDDVVVLVAGSRDQVVGRREVPRPPVALRHHVVRHPTDEVLEEAELAALGGQRVGPQRQDLLANERVEEFPQLCLVQARYGPEAGHGEGPSEDRCVLEHPPLLGRKVVEPSGDQRLEAGWHVEGLDRCRRLVGAALARQQAAVDEHADRLDRVERDALGSLEDLSAELDRKPGHRSLEEALELRRGERLQEERGEAALRGAPGRPALEELRSGGGDDEDRSVARPVDEVLDEVEERVIGPVEILEQQDRRARCRRAARRRCATR